MIRQYLFIFLLICSASVFSQKEASNWFFGNYASLTFSNNSVTNYTGSAMSVTAGCASISNAQGNLLFYTDGVTIWDQNNSVMANGTGLSGTNCAQSAVIVQKPGSSNLYYVFTVNGNGNAPGLCYSVVDMLLASGMGSVTVKNNTLYALPLAEKLCATRHCNQSDVWVMTHEIGSGNFRAYLLTSTGISTTAVISSIGAYYTNSSMFGAMKFSPNGKKLGSIYSVPTGTSYGAVSYSVELFSFNNFSGTVTPYNANNTLIMGSNSPLGNNWTYGVEFSPNSSKFYFCYYNQVGQVDLCGSNWNFSIAANTTGENNTPSSGYKGAMQLGIDGKIYISKPNVAAMAVISNPNLTSGLITYSPSGQVLTWGSCRWGLPNFLSSYFEQMPGPYTHTVLPAPNCNVVAFTAPTVCAATGYSVSGLQWDFGDPASGTANTSNLSALNHTFSSSGTYTVKLISSYYCNRNDTLVKVISISSPSFAVISSTPNCATGNVTLSASGASGPMSYSWMPGASNGSVASNLSAGIYTVNYSDTNSNCAGSFTTQVIAVTVTASATAPKCYLGTNGSATVMASNGSSNFSYVWAGISQTGSVVSNLLAGVYTVTIQNLTNPLCNFTTGVTVPSPAGINIQLSTSAASVCSGSSVVLNANISGGTNPLNGSWVGGWQPISTLSTPGLNVFTYYVTDANNCIATATCSVFVESTPTLAVAGSTQVCLGHSATLSASGAGQYSWMPGGNSTSSILINPTIPTIYTLTGNNFSCVATKTVLVNVSTASASATAPSSLCSGLPLALSGSGNGAFYWSGPAGFTSTAQTTGINAVQPIHAGTYTLLVTSVASCTAQATASVAVFVTPTVSISGNTLYCYGQVATITALGANSFSWNTGATGTSIVQPILSSTVFSVTGTNSIGGCSASAKITASVVDCTFLNQATLSSQNISVYPNPVKNELNLKFTGGAISLTELHIHNALGELVFKSKAPADKIDVSFLPAGVYYLELIGESGKKKLKFIKE